MICYRCVPLFAMVVPLLALGLAAPAWAQADSDEPPEHPVSKPMTGATLVADRSKVANFGQMSVRCRRDGKTINQTAEGKFWHLDYELEDRTMGSDEIMANYASEAARARPGRTRRRQRHRRGSAAEPPRGTRATPVAPAPVCVHAHEDIAEPGGLLGAPPMLKITPDADGPPTLIESALRQNRAPLHIQRVTEPDAIAIPPVVDATREIRFAYQAKAYKT